MRFISALTLITFLSATSAMAAETSTMDEINARIQKLEQEIALLKRLQEVQTEKTKAAAEKTASVELGNKGLKITSPDKNYELSLRGTFQYDGRAFINDDDNTGKDEFLARRVRPTLEGKAGNASFRVMPDFAGSSTRIFDAHADYKVSDEVNLRAGKFKPPIGLERLQSAADTFFMERGSPTNLVPNRDVGVMMYGNVAGDIFEYQAGIFNGNPDLGNSDGDSDDQKDLVARVFTQPFRNADTVSLQGLGVGVGGSVGERDGTTSNTLLGNYVTVGQQPFFRYRSNVYANGQQWRLYPQAYWYRANMGVITEYAISNQEVTLAKNSESLNNTAWQVATSYVLTGEDVNFRGGVKPNEDFNPQGSGWGAWEVAARTGQTDVDQDAFGLFADPNASAQKASTYGTGLSWYLSENIKWMLNYNLTTFDGGAAGGDDRTDEQALFSRVQFRL